MSARRPPRATSAHLQGAIGALWSEDAREILSVPLDHLRPNAAQPRHHFDGEALRALADSLREHGQLQPLIVRPKGADGLYELVAGERRLRAARMAGLTHLDAVVSTGDPATLALVENLQRADLNVVEVARGLQALVDQGATKAAVAQVAGLSRTEATRTIGVLRLPDVILRAVESGAVQVSKTMLWTLAEFDDTDEIEAAWQRICLDTITVAELRERLAASRDPAPQPVADEAAPAEARRVAPAFSFKRSLKAAERGLAAIAEAKPDLGEADRAALRALRDRIDGMLGEG